MQSRGGPLQPGPPVIRGLSSETSTTAQHQQQQQQVNMIKMMPGKASGYPSQYYIQSATILGQVQHQQTRRNPTGDNCLFNIQQVLLPQLQPPNQQLSPMAV